MKWIVTAALLITSHLTYSQSYPTQRVEGSDTLVIMTLQQGQAMNEAFTSLRAEIKTLKEKLDSANQAFIVDGEQWADQIAKLDLSHIIELEESREETKKVEKEKQQIRGKTNDAWIGLSAIATWFGFVYVDIESRGIFPFIW